MKMRNQYNFTAMRMKGRIYHYQSNDVESSTAFVESENKSKEGLSTVIASIIFREQRHPQIKFLNEYFIHFYLCLKIGVKACDAFTLYRLVQPEFCV